MSEIKSERVENIEKNDLFKNLERIEDDDAFKGNIEKEKADDVYHTVMKERFEPEESSEPEECLEAEEDIQDIYDEYNEKLGNLPIQENIADSIREEGCKFSEFCDRNGLEPEDCYEPTVSPYHERKMEEMGMGTDEYCNVKGINVDDILTDSSVLRDFYDQEKSEL